MRPSPRILGLAAGLVLLALGYPFAVAGALDAWGPRAVAAALLAPGVLSLGWIRRRLALPGSGPAAGGLLVLPALTALTGRALPLLLMPAAIQAVLCAVFLLSLRGGGSILQEAARRIHPYAPAFIGAYCRKVTLVFAALFAVQSALVARPAWDPPASGWAFASGVLVWAPVAVATAIEWFVRKAWFRYYGTGPVDRLLRAWMPPENTPAGRRSLEYVRAKRRELGMPPP
jgi:uncharacterized membrane protein